MNSRSPHWVEPLAYWLSGFALGTSFTIFLLIFFDVLAFRFFWIAMPLLFTGIGASTTASTMRSKRSLESGTTLRRILAERSIQPDRR